jgi:hypothetical protein
MLISFGTDIKVAFLPSRSYVNLSVRTVLLMLLLFFLGWVSDFTDASSGQDASQPERVEDLYISLFNCEYAIFPYQRMNIYEIA